MDAGMTRRLGGHRGRRI